MEGRSTLAVTAATACSKVKEVSSGCSRARSYSPKHAVKIRAIHVIAILMEPRVDFWEVSTGWVAWC